MLDYLRGEHCHEVDELQLKEDQGLIDWTDRLLSLSPRKMTDGVCPNCGAEIKIEIKEMTNSEILDKCFKISHKKK